MSREVYRYVFSPRVPLTEALATLDLALIAVESLHGESRTRMDGRFASAPARGTLAIDASTHVGQALNQIFIGFAKREFGETSFSVERVTHPLDSGREAGPSTVMGTAA